jgi:hypothetical protein
LHETVTGGKLRRAGASTGAATNPKPGQSRPDGRFKAGDPAPEQRAVKFAAKNYCSSKGYVII